MVLVSRVLRSVMIVISVDKAVAWSEVSRSRAGFLELSDPTSTGKAPACTFVTGGGDPTKAFVENFEHAFTPWTKDAYPDDYKANPTRAQEYEFVGKVVRGIAATKYFVALEELKKMTDPLKKKSSWTQLFSKKSEGYCKCLGRKEKNASESQDWEAKALEIDALLKEENNNDWKTVFFPTTEWLVSIKETEFPRENWAQINLVKTRVSESVPSEYRGEGLVTNLLKFGASVAKVHSAIFKCAGESAFRWQAVSDDGVKNKLLKELVEGKGGPEKAQGWLRELLEYFNEQAPDDSLNALKSLAREFFPEA